MSEHRSEERGQGSGSWTRNRETGLYMLPMVYGDTEKGKVILPGNEEEKTGTLQRGEWGPALRREGNETLE